MSKRHVLAAVAEVAGEAKAKVWAGLKKAALIELAEPLLAEARWLPEPLRLPRVAADERANGETKTATAAPAAA